MTNNNEIDLLIQQLEAAAAQSPIAFLTILEQIDRWQSPEQLKRALDLVIHITSNFSVAHQLATKGLALFPDDLMMQRAVRVFGPTKFLGKGPANKKLGDSMRWLRQHGHEYYGEWVAVHEGQLLAHTKEFAEITRITKLNDAKGVLIAYND